MASVRKEGEKMDDYISRQWLMECVNEGWIKFDTEKDTNTFIHLIRDMSQSVTPQTKYEDIAKAFQLSLAFGFGEKHDEMDRVMEEVKKVITPPQQTCEDAVSRCAVLDALDNHKYSNQFCEEHDIDWSINLDMAHIIINYLPPVTPKEKTGHWIITDVEGNRVWHCNCSECGNKDPQDYNIGSSGNWWKIKNKFSKVLYRKREENGKHNKTNYNQSC